MFIDSPDFPRRKVVGSSEPNGIYEIGSERTKLADFVTRKLESHSNDGQVLERFRREADEYKRNLLRRKHTYNIEPLLPSFRPAQ